MNDILYLVCYIAIYCINLLYISHSLNHILCHFEFLLWLDAWQRKGWNGFNGKAEILLSGDVKKNHLSHSSKQSMVVHGSEIEDTLLVPFLPVNQYCKLNYYSHVILLSNTSSFFTNSMTKILHQIYWNRKEHYYELLCVEIKYKRYLFNAIRVDTYCW